MTTPRRRGSTSMVLSTAAIILASCAPASEHHSDATVRDGGAADAPRPADLGAADAGLPDGQCWMTRPEASCGDGVCDPGCETPASCAADCLCTSTTQCAMGRTCTMGHCACVPTCAGRSCGDDGCGGSCGACSGGTGCTAAGHCELCTFHTTCNSCAADGNYCGWCGATSRCIHTMDSTGASVCSGSWAWSPASC